MITWSRSVRVILLYLFFFFFSCKEQEGKKGSQVSSKASSLGGGDSLGDEESSKNEESFEGLKGSWRNGEIVSFDVGKDYNAILKLPKGEQRLAIVGLAEIYLQSNNLDAVLKLLKNLPVGQESGSAISGIQWKLVDRHPGLVISEFEKLEKSFSRIETWNLISNSSSELVRQNKQLGALDLVRKSDAIDSSKKDIFYQCILEKWGRRQPAELYSYVMGISDQTYQAKIFPYALSSLDIKDRKVVEAIDRMLGSADVDSSSLQDALASSIGGNREIALEEKISLFDDYQRLIPNGRRETFSVNMFLDWGEANIDEALRNLNLVQEIDTQKKIVRGLMGRIERHDPEAVIEWEKWLESS